MQRFTLNKNLTQNFNADVDTNAKSTSGTSIQMGYTNENTNFTHNVGLVNMELGS